jgi:hypothetical protein
MKINKKKLFIITIIILLAILISSYSTIKKLIIPKNYKAVISEKEYFCFNKGYVYNPKDTVYISKFADTSSKLEILNYISGELLEVSFKSKDVINLSVNKYDELNPKTNTDYFIPNNSGIYIVVLKDKNNNLLFGDVFFVNDNNKLNSSKIKVVLSDYNWVAYNKFGGRNNYSDYITPKLIKRFENYLEFRRKYYALNIFRPNSINSNEIKTWVDDKYNFIDGRNYHCAVSEIPLIEFLLTNYPSYAIEIMDCQSFENYLGERENNLFIFNGHAEYWTNEMMVQLQNLKFTNNVLFFSGNNIYRKVKREENSLYVVENVIDEKTTSELTGLYYTTKGYMQNSAFKIVNRNHFLFKGIQSDTIGGNWVVSHETDKLTLHTPRNTLVLAKGVDVPCDLILIKNENNYLLNTGSIGSYTGLKEKNFNRFIKNYVDLTMKNSDNVTSY